MSKEHSRLRDAYHKLLESVQEIWQQGDKQDAPGSLLDKGREAFRSASDFTQKEYQDAEEQLSHDVHAFAESVQQAEDEFQGSPHYLAMQNTLWRWLAEISDKSQLEWHELAGDFRHHGVYHAGELVGLGLMECKNCHHTLHYYHPDLLPTCPDCDGTKFERKPFRP